MKVIITGASGLLGRAVLAVFDKEQDLKVQALAFTRSSSSSKLTALDLLDQKAVESFFTTEKPQYVIHCAAERRPDASAADPDKARAINAAVPAHLARLAGQLNFRLIYISTDYVFPGTNPPYSTLSPPEPLQFYGVTKREGEIAVLAPEAKGMGVVLRVPLLYGETEYNTEGPVNFLLDVVMDQSGKKYTMDTYQTRYPTNTSDVARALLKICRRFPPSTATYNVSSSSEGLILHYSSRRPFTKMEMCRVMARSLDLPPSLSVLEGAKEEDGKIGLSHLVEDGREPEVGVVRPKDTQLRLDSLAENGIEWAEEQTFEDWWAAYLGPGGKGRPASLP